MIYLGYTHTGVESHTGLGNIWSWFLLRLSLGLGLMRGTMLHGIPHKIVPELECRVFISPVSTAIFQLLEPDGVKCPNWLLPINHSLSHQLAEMLEHGFLLFWLQ